MNQPKRGSLAVIFLTVFIDLLGFGMVIPLLPKYAEVFGVDEHGLQIGLLMGCFSLMQFIFSPIWGRISDRVGRRPVLIIGLVGSTCFYALFGLATMWKSLPLLYVARLGAGLAGATIATAQAYIADCTTLENRSRGMALIGVAFGMGFTFGPLLGAAAFLGGQEHVAVSPWPGFLASGLSAVALATAIFRLPESLHAESRPAGANWLSLQAWRDALAIPTIGVLLVVMFISIVAFGGFETTLTLLLSGKKSQFHFELPYVLLTYAMIGFTLAVVQGGIVRRLSGKVSEVRMALLGGALTIVGFGGIVVGIHQLNLPILYVATAIEVSGFALMSPSLQALISRRSDPARQGAVLGVAQGISSLARMTAPIAIPLSYVDLTLPYWVGMALIGLGMVLLQFVAHRGRDFGSPAPAAGHDSVNMQ